MGSSEVWVLFISHFEYATLLISQNSLEVSNKLSAAWVNLQPNEPFFVFAQSIDRINSVSDFGVLCRDTHLDGQVEGSHFLHDSEVIRLSSLAGAPFTCCIAIDPNLRLVCGKSYLEHLAHLRDRALIED